MRVFGIHLKIERDSLKERKRAPGQTLVEVAIMLPILVSLVMGALDLGRIFYWGIVMKNAAREGVYYLSSNISDCKATPALVQTRQRVKDEANKNGLALIDGEITMVQGTCPASGEPVTIRVQHTGTLTIFAIFYPSIANLYQTATMAVQ